MSLDEDAEVRRLTQAITRRGSKNSVDMNYPIVDKKPAQQKTPGLSPPSQVDTKEQKVEKDIKKDHDAHQPKKPKKPKKEKPIAQKADPKRKELVNPNAQNDTRTDAKATVTGLLNQRKINQSKEDEKKKEFKFDVDENLNWESDWKDKGFFEIEEEKEDLSDDNYSDDSDDDQNDSEKAYQKRVNQSLSRILKAGMPDHIPGAPAPKKPQVESRSFVKHRMEGQGASVELRKKFLIARDTVLFKCVLAERSCKKDYPLRILISYGNSSSKEISKIDVFLVTKTRFKKKREIVQLKSMASERKEKEKMIVEELKGGKGVDPWEMESRIGHVSKKLNKQQQISYWLPKDAKPTSKTVQHEIKVQCRVKGLHRDIRVYLPLIIVAS